MSTPSSFVDNFLQREHIHWLLGVVDSSSVHWWTGLANPSAFLFWHSKSWGINVCVCDPAGFHENHRTCSAKGLTKKLLPKTKTLGTGLSGTFAVMCETDWTCEVTYYVTDPEQVLDSVNSRLQVLGGNTYLGVNSMHFFNVFCILGVFLGGIWDSGGKIPPRR